MIASTSTNNSQQATWGRHSCRRARFQAGFWRLAVPRKAISGRKPSGRQAASVVSVSAASGSFEDFSSAGTAADAKASKLTTGASTPRAKI